MVSGCPIPELLEAAHLLPYEFGHLDHVENGILLRRDVHTLFDLDAMGIDPSTLDIRIHPAARAAGYAELDGRRLLCPRHARPSVAGLVWRWNAFRRRCDRDEETACAGDTIEVRGPSPHGAAALGACSTL